MLNFSPNLDQLLQTAIQHYQAGRLSEAEALYRQILQQNPRHADALHLLGVLANRVHRSDVAVDLIQQAIAINPGNSEAHTNLGNALKDLGRLDEAIAAFRQAITLRANSAEAHNNLGTALQAAGRHDEAIAAYRQAIALKPQYPKAYNNLGVSLADKGQLEDAVAAFRQAITFDPNYAAAHYNLGRHLKDLGRLDEAIAANRQAIALKSNFAEAHNNLGNALAEKGQGDDAIAAYRQAVSLKPDYAEAFCNLGNALTLKRQFEGAVAAYRQALNLKPQYPEALSNLGSALEDQGQPDEAVVAYRQALSLNPNLPETCSNLGNVLKDQGRLDDAIAAYRQALSINPDLPKTGGNLLLTMHYHPHCHGQTIAQEFRRWNEQFAAPLSQFIQPHTNDRDPERPLRIGYVSPDLRNHVIGRLLLPILTNHNKREVKVIAYAQVPEPDAMTQRLRACTDEWRSIVGLSDAQAADLIRQDKIDILVDLTLHTAHSRLLIFARKPAPVQVTWLGYPGSTGLTTIDYRLSDPYLDPPGTDESIYSEQTFRLPHSFWCYDPVDERDIPVGPLPALDQGVVTFGCLNNFCKLNEDVFTLWAKVLKRVERSRLLLLAVPGSHQQWAVDRLHREGIDPKRVEFAPLQPRRNYLELYHRIDLGLDSFPYNGHTTSLDSFWMGVPVVTWVGGARQTAVSRAGWCALSNLGLPELAGHTAEEFVEIAVALANDLPRLQHLRSTLRQKMEQSPLMDAPRFTRDIEQSYRQMWRKWCATDR